ncbi:MAG: DeoR/GlpR family DNA-binding transcription regulator [Mobilitalea sp.]
MLTIERRNKILEILKTDGRVVVGDLSAMFKVTEETIRRDLEKLENQGFAKKTYGGAIIADNATVDIPFLIRKQSNVESKEHIAALVCSMVDDGDHLMLDASSTAVYIAKQLKSKKNLTLITNSIEIMLELSDISGWKILSTGGTLREGSLSLVGYQAEKMISTFHVDKSIISCKGIDIRKGITDSNEMDAHIKKLMLESSNMKILAVDQTKFNRISFTKIEDISGVDTIVTDKQPSEDWKNVFENNNTNYRYK